MGLLDCLSHSHSICNLSVQEIVHRNATLQVNECAWQFHDSLEASGPQGLKGFTDLRPEEQTEVEQLVAEHLAKVRQAQVNLGGQAANNGPLHLKDQFLSFLQMKMMTTSPQ